MSPQTLKDAETDVHEILADYSLSEEEVEDCAARMINLLTDAVESVFDDEEEMARIKAARQLDTRQS